MLGLNPASANALLLALITLAVVTSFRTVGSLLVFGLLVAPPATAALVSRRVPVMMVVAAAIGILAVLVGLLISWYAGTAAGATMAGVAVAIFFVVLVGRDLVGRPRSTGRCRPADRRLGVVRLGIDLDGVVADFNSGWVTRYNEEFGTDIPLDAMRAWNGIPSLTHFRDMGEFWRWARDHGGHSMFRHLETYPGAVETLSDLRRKGHDVVILTSKPNWAVHDTFAWIADHRHTHQGSPHPRGEVARSL